MALIPGNLLSENNQSVETSVGGWASFSSVSSGVVQSGTQFLEGTKSVQSTANAGTAGALGGLVTTVDLPVVKAGISYVWSYFVFSPKKAIFNANLDFYQANNTTFVSSVNSPGQEVPVNTWTRITGGGVAPALSGVARLYLQVTSGLANLDVVFFDVMFFGSPLAAEIISPFLPGGDPQIFAPWSGAPDASHDVIVNAQTASARALVPSTRPFLLLALSSESGPGATVQTFNDAAVLPQLFQPDDLTGGIAPWGGAPDSTAPAATTATAGTATAAGAALGPTAGLGSLPGTGAGTAAGQTPGTGIVTQGTGAAAGTGAVGAPVPSLGSVPGSAAGTGSASGPTPGLGALPGTGTGTGAALTASSGVAALGTGTATAAGTAQPPVAGLGALPGTGTAAGAALAPTPGLGALPGTAPATGAALTASDVAVDGPVAQLTQLFMPDDLTGGMAPWGGAEVGIITGDAAVNAGVATAVGAALGPVAGLGALPGTATAAGTALGPTAGLGAQAGSATAAGAASGPMVAVAAGPGRAQATTSAFTETPGLGALPGTAPANGTAYGATGLGSGTGMAGVATATGAALQPVAGLGAGPGTAAGTGTGRTASAGLAVLGTGTAPAGATAQNPSAAFSGTATAGVATGTGTARSASTGLGSVPGTANSAATARQPVPGLSLRAVGVATMTAVANDVTPVVPQVPFEIQVSGRESLSAVSGRESPGPVRGRETAGQTGAREPVSSVSGSEPATAVQGEEAGT